MKILGPLAAVTAFFLIAVFAVSVGGMAWLFGILIPYAALLIFLAGVAFRIADWVSSPVPFRIPTTCGQQKSLPWVSYSRLDNPSNAWETAGRMFLEVLFFRSLFRNNRPQLRPRDSNQIVFGPTKWLWLGGLVFHWTLLTILLRHFRFFSEPVPLAVGALVRLDGFFRVGLPVVYATSVLFVVALGFLLGRRLFSRRLRRISLPGDYFPLFLLLGIALSGLFLRHWVKTDVEAVKELAMGLVAFNPSIPENLSPIFFGHLFLVSTLFIYFPFSKLLHAPGVFLSPTRNLANNSRRRRHINPWNAPVPVHTYQEWEDEFRPKMVAAGIPVEKEDNA